jgi:hypothetical protein
VKEEEEEGDHCAHGFDSSIHCALEPSGLLYGMACYQTDVNESSQEESELMGEPDSMCMGLIPEFDH